MKSKGEASEETATACGTRRGARGRGAGARGGRPSVPRGLPDSSPVARVQRFPRPSRAPTTPGRINDPVTGATVLAGGAEYFATHMKALGSENGNTFVVGAGDMIGGTPLLSGALPRRADDRVPQSDRHRQRRCRQPRVRRGPGRAPAHAVRQQLGGRLPSGRRLPGRHAVLRVGVRLPGGQRRRRGHAQPDPARLRLSSTRARERSAFIGETLENTPLIVTPSGVAGLDFLDEADTANALVPQLKASGRGDDRSPAPPGRLPERAVLARLPRRERLRELQRA